MFKTIKKNQKKFMAIFAAGLMIAFTLPTFFGQQNTNRGDAAFGYIGNNDLSTQRVQEARTEWEFLRSSVTVEIPDRETQQMRPQSLAVALLGQRAAEEISKNPEMFALLQEEAMRMGVGISSDSVKSMLANNKAKYPVDTDGNADATTMQAVHNLLLVYGGFDRIAAAAHVSGPLRDHELATRQEVATSFVEFNARDYLARLPAVLEAKDLQAHFDQYKNMEAGSTPTSKWGFGYKVPNKVRVQYLVVEQDRVHAAVEGIISPVDLVKYYKLHPETFPAVEGKPKTLKDYHLGSSLADTRSTTQSAAARFFDHGPPLGVAVLLGYDHYRDAVKKAVIADRSSELMKQMLADITGAMSTDYVAFTKATGPKAGEPPLTTPTDLSAAGPPSSVGASYGSKEYLEKLALYMQEKYKVLPTVQTVGELKSAKELGELPGIGKTSLRMDQNVLMAIFQSRNMNLYQQVERRLEFGNYASSLIESLMTDADREFARNFRVPTMAVYQPSPALEDDKQNQYIFRAAEAVIAHPPASLSDVKAHVEADLRLVQAYNLALKDAQTFLAQARTQRLQPAAAAATRPVFSTGLFGGEMSIPPDYALPNPVATTDFISGVYETLRTPSPADPAHPLGLIELKEQEVARVLVDEIAAVKPGWRGDQLASNQLEVQAEVTGRARELLRAQWFRFDDLEKRLSYRPANPKKSQQPNKPEQDAPEQNPFM